MTHGPGDDGHERRGDDDDYAWPAQDIDGTPPVPSAGRPSPERIGNTEAAEPESPARPRRRTRRIVAAGLVVVLLAAAGGVLAVGDVANRLELPWAPNAPHGPEPDPVAVQRDITAAGDDGRSGPTADGVAAAIEDPIDDPALGTMAGSVVDPARGETLWESDASTPLTPASTTKLLTSAAALLALEHGSTVSTKVVAGDQPGSVIIVGGGDPTLSSVDDGDGAYPGAAELDDLVAQVSDAVDGDVRSVAVDTSAFAGPQEAPGWAPGDAPSTFMAPVQPAMLDGGRTDPTDPRSPRTGDPTGELAAAFAERIGAEVGDTDATAATDAEVLGEVESPPIAELVETSVRTSDNLLSEVIARQVAVATGKEPSFAGGAEATEEVLADGGFDTSGLRLSDASGLSTDNRVPARLLTDVLAAAAADDAGDADADADGGDDADDAADADGGAGATGDRARQLRPLLAGLPVAGGTGTLADRYEEGDTTAGKGWVRAKTGTLSAVNSLAGVVLDTDGDVLVFALMSTGTGPDEARPALDAVVAALRECGCR